MKPVLVTVVIILVGAVVFFLVKSNSLKNLEGVSVNDIEFKTFELTGDTFRAKGKITAKGKSFREYAYNIKGNTLYFMIYGGEKNSEYPSRKFSIEISDKALREVTTVYLKSNKDMTILITK